MKWLISDANILVDMMAGSMLLTLFLLPMQFGITYPVQRSAASEKRSQAQPQRLSGTECCAKSIPQCICWFRMADGIVYR